jgi:hypothetical protein
MDEKHYSNCCHAYMDDPEREICPKCKEGCVPITEQDVEFENMGGMKW